MKKLKTIFILIILIIVLLIFVYNKYENSKIEFNLNNSINKGANYLLENQNQDGSVSLNNDDTFKIWETANTFIVVRATDSNKKSFINNATDFLLSVQRDDGLFYHTISFGQNDYCMETTSLGILALNGNETNVDKGISFLLNQQNKDGSWEIGTPFIKTDRFFPSVTGFVLSSLMCQNIYNENISKGIEYIQKSQHEDGSWGSSWIYYDTPYYATYVNLLALKLYGLENSNNYRNAIDYIKGNQNIDGSWGNEDFHRPSKNLRTSLALNSLLVSPDKENSEAIEKGIRWLIQKQQGDGSWDGGYFVDSNKKEDIFATDMAILSLIRYRHYKNNEIFLCPIHS